MKRLRLFLAGLGRRTAFYPIATPPVGLMALAAYLRNQLPVDPVIVNQRLDNSTPEQIVRQASAYGADVVGFSILTTSACLLPEVVRLTRQALPKALILVGGPHASQDTARALMNEAGVDVVVPGEGELPAEAVLQAWLDGRSDFGGVPQIAWRDGSGEVVTNPGPPLQVEDLDSLPLPAYDLIDLPAYWKTQSMAPIYRRRYASLVSSRGCPYLCIWCHKIFGKSIRMQSAERVVDDMSYLIGKYGPAGMRDFEFLDDNFNFSARRTIAIGEGLLNKGLRVKMAFPNGLRADLLNQEVVDVMVGAGMNQCSLALETGSPRLQKYTGKVMNIPKLLDSAEYIAAQGVYTNLFCMMGFPTETEDELRTTIDVACQSAFHSASFFTVTPFPGTALYDMVQRDHPEKLAGIRYDATDFSQMRVNLTDMPDEKLFYYQRLAQRRFYANPGRLARLVRCHPQRWMLPAYLPIFLHRAAKGWLAS